MNKLPTEIQCNIYCYLECELVKISVLNKSINRLFNSEKNSMAYKILKRYGNIVTYVDAYNDAYEILKYITKYKLELILNRYLKEYYCDCYDYEDEECEYNYKNILVDAVENNCLQMTKYLIMNGFEIGDDDPESLETPLINYTYGRNLEMIKLLVTQGAYLYGNEYNWDDSPILSIAVEFGKLDIIKYLVGAGIDIHYNNNTALKNAAYNNNLEVVKYLVEMGANVNAINNDGSGILTGYVKDINMFKYLVEIGANINIIDNSGKSVLMYHIEKGKNFDIINYLLEKDVIINLDEILLMSLLNKYNFEIVKRVFKHYLYKWFGIIDIKIGTRMDIIRMVIDLGIRIHRNDWKIEIQNNTDYDLDVLKSLTQSNVTLNKEHILCTAVKNNNFEMVKCLVENGVDIHTDNEFAFKRSYEDCNITMYNYLVRHL